MKGRLILFLHLIGQIALPTSLNAEVLSLRKAQELAVEKSLAVKAAKVTKDNIDVKLATFESAYNPRLGVAGGVDIEAGLSEQRATPLAFLYGSYTFYNGGKKDLHRSMIQAEIAAANQSVPSLVFAIEREMEVLFLEIAMKHAAIRLKEEALKVNKRHRLMATKRRLAGLVSETDVLEFDLIEGIFQREVEITKREVDVTKRLLGRKLGLPESFEVETLDIESPQTIQPTLDNLLQDALANHPARLRVQHEAKAIELEAQLNDADWGPKVDIEGRLGYLPLDSRPEDKKAGASVTLTATLDLFSDGMRSATKRELLSKREVITSLLDAEIQQLEFLAADAFGKAKILEGRREIEKKSLLQAKRYYKATLDEYGRGLKNSPDVAGASTLVTDARARLLETAYEWHVQKIELEKALGMTVESVMEDKQGE